MGLQRLLSASTLQLPPGAKNDDRGSEFERAREFYELNSFKGKYIGDYYKGY